MLVKTKFYNTNVKKLFYNLVEKYFTTSLNALV